MFEFDQHFWQSPFFGLFPPTSSDLTSNSLLSACLSHESSASSCNGSSSAFSFSDSAYASSQSPPPASTNSTEIFSTINSSQSISIMRSLATPQLIKGQTSLFTGLTTTSSSSTSSSVHSYGLASSLQQENIGICSSCHEGSKETRLKILPCFHSLCEFCLEKISSNGGETIVCPSCGLSSLLTEVLPDYTRQMSDDYILSLGNENSSNCVQYCTACKSSESMAVAKCFECLSFLCHQCVCAHQIMNCFEGHRVVHIKDLDANGNDLRLLFCPTHKNETLKYFCATCNIPICLTCTTNEHGRPGHDFVLLNDGGSHYVAKLQHLVENTRQRLMDLKQSQKTIDQSHNSLQSQYNKARNDINETYNFYRQLIDERKHELIKELENIFNEKEILLTNQIQKFDEAIERATLPLEFSDRLFKNSSTTEILMFKKQLENKMNNVHQTSSDGNGQCSFELEFVSNFQAIQTGVRNTFGYVRSSSEPINHLYKPRPQKLINDNFSKVIGPPSINANHQQIGRTSPTKPLPSSSTSNQLLNGIDILSCSLPQSTMTKYNHLSSSNPTAIHFPLSSNSLDLHSYDLWSNAAQLPTNSSHGLVNLNGHETGMDLNDGFSSMSHHLSLPSRSNNSATKRQKMIYHQKFGEFGVLEGQFTEPSGVAVNGQGDIIVADTNNHRIQIFDSNGRFRFQFGECGKRDGQLLYPNRVAVFRQTGDIIVTERSPTHQIQIYNQYGQFIRKFGANVLQHPRGVCVDNLGRIIVVECKVMRVFIFDINGNVLNKFTCSKYLEFPNGVCCNDKQEIFISDNRAHCIKVFNYDGQFLRTVGSEGLTNYPIGVVQNSQGDVLIADNHNNFNLTIFSQDGQLISALESKVKHAQCFDVALMDDGSVVLASKDYRIYVYRYLMSSNGSPPSPLSSSSSTTPNSCSQLTASECLSPSLLNGHVESPLTIATANGY